MPVVNTSNNSERVILSRYGRITSADSIPTKMFAALESDSAPLIFIVRWKSLAKRRTNTCSTRR
jgi:hypothetical protein